MQKQVWHLLKDATKSAISEVKYFFTFNLRYLAVIVEVSCPIVMYFVGQSVALRSGQPTVGAEVVVPIIVAIVVYYMKEISNRCNKGVRIPVPNKRFTEVDADTGEVNIHQDRLQEMILYLADLEDWLERKGWL